jgi:hypothetical protein
MSKALQSSAGGCGFAALYSTSALVSGWIYGAAVGARQQVSGQDFYGLYHYTNPIERFFNSSVAALAYSCFGIFLGGIIGFGIGMFAVRFKYGTVMAVAMAIVIPLLTKGLTVGHNRPEEDRQMPHPQSAAQIEHAAYEYQQRADQMTAGLRQFQNNMGDLNYSNSDYLGSPAWASLKYRSHDDMQTVEHYYTSLLGISMSHSVDGDPHVVRNAEFRRNGLHGEVTLENTGDGTNDTFITFTALDL